MGPGRIDLQKILLIAIVVAFFVCGSIRLSLPPWLVFDEPYYLNAAASLAEARAVVNREHPMLAKEILAIGFWLFGDNLGLLRLLPLMFGSAGLYFAALALWRHTGSASTAIIFAVLLASGFLLLGLSRLALLEPFGFFFAALAFYFQASRNPLLAAAAIGFSVACKWTAIPLAAALVAVHLIRRDWALALKFGVVSGFSYLVTFTPGFFVAENPLRPLELLRLQFAMEHRISLFIRGHPYGSDWWQWIYGGGHLFAASGVYAGAERVALIVANPVTALPALLAALSFRDRFISIVGLVSLALFPLSGKPVLLIHQFLYAHTFMLAALAIVLARFARWKVGFILALPVAAMAVYLPAITSGREPIIWPWKIREADLTVGAAERANLERATHCLDHPLDCD